MSTMLIKLDENMSVAHAEFLRQRGYDCDRVTDEGLSGADDEIVWQQACAEGRFFITLDLDFSDVRRFPPGTHPGILMKVVLDTNIFVSGWLWGGRPDRLLKLTEVCLITVCASEQLLNELQSTLTTYKL